MKKTNSKFKYLNSKQYQMFKKSNVQNSFEIFDYLDLEFV
jgi:hypothetical protein